MNQGNLAEKQAANHYLQNGYQILERNWRYFSRGRGQKAEIDIIAYQGKTIIFVEVKFRSTGFVPLNETITERKLQFLRTAALAYLTHHSHYRDYHVRFDAVFISPTKIEVIENIV